MYKKLVNPEYRLNLTEDEVTGGFSLTYVSSRESHCDYCRVYLSEELADLIEGADVGECSVYMGNEEDYDLMIEGSGTWGENGEEILILDDMKKLFQTNVQAAFVDISPEEAVRYILTVSGVERYSIADIQKERKTFSIPLQNAVDAVMMINSAWGIDVAFFFWNGVFHWGTDPDQEELCEIGDENLLDLEQNGDLWIAEVVGIPWIHHSQLVLVNCDELICVAMVEKCEIRSAEYGESTDMWLTLREVQDG